MKVSKENFGWIFACVALALALGISVYLGVSGFFIKNTNNYATDMQLGKALQLDVSKNGANSISVNLDGSYLPGQELPQIVGVKNVADEAVFIRAKVYIYSFDNKTIPLNINQTANWKLNEEDGYLYYNGLLTSQNKSSLCSDIILNEDDDIFSSKKYIVTFLAESLGETFNAEQIWNVSFSELFPQES